MPLCYEVHISLEEGAIPLLARRFSMVWHPEQPARATVVDATPCQDLRLPGCPVALAQPALRIATRDAGSGTRQGQSAAEPRPLCEERVSLRAPPLPAAASHWRPTPAPTLPAPASYVQLSPTAAAAQDMELQQQTRCAVPGAGGGTEAASACLATAAPAQRGMAAAVPAVFAEGAAVSSDSSTTCGSSQAASNCGATGDVQADAATFENLGATPADAAVLPSCDAWGSSSEGSMQSSKDAGAAALHQLDNHQSEQQDWAVALLPHLMPFPGYGLQCRSSEVAELVQEVVALRQEVRRSVGMVCGACCRCVPSLLVASCGLQVVLLRAQVEALQLAPAGVAAAPLFQHYQWHLLALPQQPIPPPEQQLSPPASLSPSESVATVPLGNTSTQQQSSMPSEPHTSSTWAPDSSAEVHVWTEVEADIDRLIEEAERVASSASCYNAPEGFDLLAQQHPQDQQQQQPLPEPQQDMKAPEQPCAASGRERQACPARPEVCSGHNPRITLVRVPSIAACSDEDEGGEMAVLLAH